MTLRIANGAGFLGDNVDAPKRLVEAAEVDYLTLEYLAELTMSILARLRQKNPATGYAADFLPVLSSLLPALARQPQLRIITNAGGVNPLACARAAARLLAAAGRGADRLGVVLGDDLLPRLAELQAAGCKLPHFDTGQPLAELQGPVVSAHAYLGAAPIVAALAEGARLVLTGRVADASLTVAPAAHAWNVPADDWDRLAAFSVAGHLIECGAQVTGGYSVRWQDLNLADVGYPIAELEADGTTVITKPPGTGGTVDRLSVTEQLVYEIGDPRHYLTPDVDVDFTRVELMSIGRDRVQVRHARGRPAPDDYKVSLAYADGHTASAQLLVAGRDAVARARACAELVFARLARAGWTFARTSVELLGAGAGVPGLAPPPADGAATEVVLRLGVHDPRREAVERFTWEIAPLITSGPAGLAGYAAGRSPVRSVYAYWPTTIPKSAVTPQVVVRTADEWLHS